MRILHVIDTGGPGGAETVLANIVENLDPDDFTSRVVVPDRGWLHERLTAQKQDVTILPRRRSPDVAFLWGLLREIGRFDADLVHAHLLTSSVYGSMAATLRGRLPLIATFHGLPDVPEGDRLLPLKAAILSRSRNHVVFVAEHLRRKVQERLGLADGACHTIHNGIRLPSERLSRSAERGGGDRRRVGALGNVRPAKDYPTLMRAARFACDRLPDVDFYIAGSGSPADMDRLRDLRDSLDLTDRVVLLGFVEDVRTFLLGLDVFVSTSRTEGLPLSLVEAASMGCPIVATRCGGNREALTGHPSLVPTNDPRAVADEIVSTLEHPGSARAQAEKLALDVRRRFGLRRMVDRYSDLYRLAARGPGTLRHRHARRSPP